jgi:IS605 OrfB family transposase
VLGVNHVIPKKIVSLPYDVMALEALEPAKMKINGKGKKSRRKLGSRSAAELQRLIEYKAGDSGRR